MQGVIPATAELCWIIVLIVKMVGVCYWYVLVILWSAISLLHTTTIKAPKIKDCPEVCNCLGTYVDCSSKKFEFVPSNLPKWTTHLDLHNNAIKKLNDGAWKNLTNLTELKLGKNDIVDIPKDAFSYQRRLKILELNRNRLKDIDALTFKHLEHLTALKLKKNEITQLKDGAFYGLNRIDKLILDYNYVQVIRKGWVYGLESLKELSISHNGVTDIEKDAWELCKLLTVLDLSYNDFKSIKADTFKHLGNLHKLLLNNNDIAYIQDNAFVHLPNLKFLHLSNNKISYTIEDANGVYRGLGKLLKFHLSGNNIKSINKKAFVGLSSVRYLNLTNNNITSIQKNAFLEMPLLKDLLLNTSALICDCNIQWFSEWLIGKNYTIQTICAYPPWVRGHMLLQISLTNFTCDELPKPRLIEEPAPEMMALKGENVVLNCKAMSSSSSDMTFKWKKDNVDLDIKTEVIKDTDGKSMETSVSKLNIVDVQHSDAGIYQCVVSNTYGSTYSQKSKISVLTHPTFEKMPSNVTVQAGETARLECAALGEPPPEIRWQKDGGNDFPAARERRMHVMPTDDVFFIVNTKPVDMGVYSCTAWNPAGTIVANATLTIQEKPSFVKAMENKDVTAGELVVLQCMAGGIPKPTIAWLKDGEAIRATERHFFTAEDQLMIVVDTVQSDSGSYQCHLNNSLGEVTGSCFLTINPNSITTYDLMGIIIITVACCAVLTSLIWVIIIYQTRKGMVLLANTSELAAAGASASAASAGEGGLSLVVDIGDTTVAHFADDSSDHSSCKDSGTGDSAKRSTDDLAPEDFNALTINEGLPVRASSLQCLQEAPGAPEGVSSSHTPLLQQGTSIEMKPGPHVS